MAEEYEDQIDPQAEPEEPQEEPGGIDENERRTWEGRLRTEQDRIANTRSQLQAMGWDLDDQGNPYQVQQYANQYQQPADQQEDDEFDWTVQNVRQLIRQEAQQIAAQQVGGLLPVVEQTLQATYEQRYSDFNDIKPETTTILRQMGFSSLAHAQAVNPAAVTIAMDAARGRKAAAAPLPPDPRVEAQRQERIAAGVTGGSGGTPQGGSKTFGFSPEEIAQIAAMGLTPEDADRMLNDGKARVKIGGK